MAVPPFNLASAHSKVKAAQAAWNSKLPSRIALAYTPDSVWRNRDQFVRGREDIISFLEKKWEREKNYTLRKELFAFRDNKIAVQFWYEYSTKEDKSSDWFRCYGLEHWVFDAEGKMASRQMSGNDIPIKEEERWFKDGVDLETIVIPEGHWSLSEPLQ